MIRLLWLAPGLRDPEESFAQLSGLRPSPEPVAFAEATAEFVGERQADVVLVDAREQPAEAAALIGKLNPEIDIPIVAILEEHDLDTFDWSVAPAELLVSSCSRGELIHRLRRLVDPPQLEAEARVRRGPISINRDRFEVKLHSDLLDLTFKEFELLDYLARRPGKVCSRGVLLQEVWGYDFFGGTRTVDVHIRRLRAKLGTEAHRIETVRHVGYRFSG